MHIDKNAILEGENIRLRRVSISDVNSSYYQWMNDPEVNRFMETRFRPQAIEDIKTFVQKMDADPCVLFMAIIYKNNNVHVGNIKLGPINWIHRFADVSLVIGDKRYWRKGIATEAIGLVTKFAFHNLNLHKLKAGCYIENIGSINAFKKTGFQEEGLLKQHRYFEEKFTDQILLGLINSKWEE